MFQICKFIVEHLEEATFKNNKNINIRIEKNNIFREGILFDLYAVEDDIDIHIKTVLNYCEHKTLTHENTIKLLINEINKISKCTRCKSISGNVINEFCSACAMEILYLETLDEGFKNNCMICYFTYNKFDCLRASCCNDENIICKNCYEKIGSCPFCRSIDFMDSYVPISS